MKHLNKSFVVCGLASIVLTSFLGSCGKSTERASSQKDVVTVGPHGHVYAVIKQGDFLLIRQCPDLTVVEYPADFSSKCTFSPTVRQRTVSPSQFKDLMWKQLFQRTVRDAVSTSSYQELLKFRENTIVSIRQEIAYAAERIARIEEFVAKFPGNAGQYEKELVQLKAQMTRYEKVAPVIESFNKTVDTVVEQASGELGVVFYQSTNPSESLVVALVQSLLAS